MISSPETQTAAPTVPGKHGNAMIELDRVTFGYAPGSPLLRDLSWRVEPGASWSILGPSGSGKTTLLYLLAGLRQPSGGAIRFEGATVNGTNDRIGLMLQDYGLLPWMTARQNVELGLKIRKVPRNERRQIAAEWLERMEIAHVAGNFPAQLSGGQRQRVALARVLALGTKLLLLDEPLSAVDELTRERLQRTLWEIKTELDLTLIMVTHSVEEAALLTDRVLIFPDQPPLEAATVLQRPVFESVPSRGDSAFQDFCVQVREELQL